MMFGLIDCEGGLFANVGGKLNCRDQEPNRPVHSGKSRRYWLIAWVNRLNYDVTLCIWPSG